MKTQSIVIPFIPSKIDLNDLNNNRKLLSDEHITQIKQQFLVNGRYRYLGKQRLPFAVVKQDDDYFAIYRGRKKGLGKGSYGQVKLVQNLITGEWVVVKVQAIGSKSQLERLNNEVAALTKTKKAIMTPQHDPILLHRESQHKKRMQSYLLMKLAKGRDLHELRDKSPHYPPIIYINAILDMLQEIKTLHDEKFLHRDIKLDNILFDLSNGNLSLIDLGFAHPFSNKRKLPDTDYLGTDGYIADELTTGKNTYFYAEKTEIFAVGVTIGKLLKYIEKIDLLETETKIFYYDSIKLAANSVLNFSEDSNLNGAIYSYTQRMTDSQSNQRPTVLQSIKFFQQIKKQLSVHDRTVSIGLVDVVEFIKIFNQPDKIVLNNYINNLKQYDRISLMTQQLDNDPYFYVKWKRVLENLGLVVTGDMFHGLPVSEIANELTSQVQQDESGCIFQYKHQPIPEYTKTVFFVSVPAHAAKPRQQSPGFFSSFFQFFNKKEETEGNDIGLQKKSFGHSRSQ